VSMCGLAWLTVAVLTTQSPQLPPCAQSQPDSVCKCPPGTERLLQPPSADLGVRQGGAVSEEACWKAAGSGIRVRHGPCVIWGPNGERLAEGAFVFGKKNGVWHQWTTVQEVTEYWTAGHYDSVRVVGTPQSFMIDFCACRPQSLGAYWGFGSNGWEVLDAGPDSCRIRTWVEMEGSYLPRRQFRVPRSLGRQTYIAQPHGRIDFSALEPYFETSLGGGGSIWQRRYK
jgi:hypothetical protein